jgi:hypothetical protein
VQNPHEILPLQSIQFFPGTLGEAPQVTVAETAVPGAGETVLTTPAPPVKLVADPNPPDLPERLRKPVAVAGIPESIPKWNYRRDQRQEVDFELGVRKRLPVAQESLPYFISSGTGAVMGEIVETELGGKTAADYQYIFIKLNGEMTDKNVLAVKDMGAISDPVEGSTARLIEAQGEIEILDIVDHDKSLYRALVKRAIVPVEVGAQLVAGKIPNYNASSSGTTSQAMARVVGGEFSIQREIFANRGILFLSGQGLDVGEICPIFKVHKKRVEKSQISSNDRQIGKVKVIQVSGSFATAVVIDSKEDIQVGDITNPDVRIK